ncbi:unnamed protein product [Arctogadus glacialis]
MANGPARGVGRGRGAARGTKRRTASLTSHNQGEGAGPAICGGPPCRGAGSIPTGNGRPSTQALAPTPPASWGAAPPPASPSPTPGSRRPAAAAPTDSPSAGANPAASPMVRSASVVWRAATIGDSWDLSSCRRQLRHSRTAQGRREATWRFRPPGDYSAGLQRPLALPVRTGAPQSLRQW